MKSIKAKCVILVYLFILPIVLNAQQIKAGFEIPELYKIAEGFQKESNLSFNVNYTYADSAYPSTILEQLSGSYKIKDGKYWSMMDSVEYIQGNTYSLTVYHKDQTIAISDRQTYGTLLQVSMMDSLFRDGNVFSIAITELNDSTRSFVARFNEESYYKKYEIQYDLLNYRVKKIQYHIKEHTDSSTSSGVAIITMNFSNYSEIALDGNHFNEEKFVYREGEYIKKKTAYSAFKLLTNVTGAINYEEIQ